ncbi:hypothetical protein AXG93_374s1200 [Marchantia polymorpha subsp. ruderalis]|uniref:Uncharacterized protein n=1 Tax=Marchantia polymorpha subsp. ruderalis TaxID=1480154 RepID=A0A176WJF8_MARPO|nr:hypothetical protein AXG93_374s1200 [Marchantia polymorpha subsp. ruderalis]
MGPKKSDKVRKLIHMKVPYKELQPFRREVSKLRLEFLLWDWNCVSASICKEIMDKNETEGVELRGNPMLWTIEHWTKVMGPCAGSDGDLLFEKNSVRLTNIEEFSYRPLFNSGRQGTNGWKTADYIDPKRRAIALGIMHILRPARTTYVTAWQVWFFEQILKGQGVHWAMIFHDLVWMNASDRWTGPLVNHLTPFLVIFYRGMDLLTREEEKQFPKEREILTAESSEGTKDDTRRPSIPPQTTTRGPVQVEVVRRREKPKRRLAKRRRVVSDDEGDLALEVRRTETEVEVIRQSRTRARPKKRVNRELVAAEVSDSSVKKTVVPIVSTPEVGEGESTQPGVMEVPLGMLIKVPADAPAEPLKEGMKIVSPTSLSSERTRSVGSEETPHPKISEEFVKELTLSDKVLEQFVAQVGVMVVDAPDSALPSSLAEEVRHEEETKTSEEEPKELVVSFPDFLHDSVVPLLKYLDGKREKYAVSKEVGFYVEMVRNRTQLKRALEVKREWDSATELARERAANLATECAAVKESGRCAELKETCGELRKSNENGHKMTMDLLTSLEKSREAYEEAVKRSERLITTAEKQEKHIEELATLEARRAEEVRIAEELRGKIEESKTAEEDLRSKISEIEGKCEAEFRHAEELSASMTECVGKHEEELANWAKKLADCESARSSEVKCKLKVESECQRLRQQLGKADMRSQESQRRMEKVEKTYRQLRDETTDELKLRLEKCLNGFAMWGLQTVKWLKLDSIELRLMSAKTSGSARHQQIVELVNTS